MYYSHALLVFFFLLFYGLVGCKYIFTGKNVSSAANNSHNVSIAVQSPDEQTKAQLVVLCYTYFKSCYEKVVKK